jgi:hypothetical protein
VKLTRIKDSLELVSQIISHFCPNFVFIQRGLIFISRCEVFVELIRIKGSLEYASQMTGLNIYFG